MISPHDLEQDDFWNISRQEQKTRDFLRSRREQLERVIAVGRKTLALRAQPGFQEFMGSIEELKHAELQKLLAFDGSGEQMRIVQGKAQAFSDILGLLRDTENSVKMLEERLKIAEDEEARVLTPDGKVITNQYGGRDGGQQQ